MEKAERLIHLVSNPLDVDEDEIVNAFENAERTVIELRSQRDMFYKGYKLLFREFATTAKPTKVVGKTLSSKRFWNFVAPEHRLKDGAMYIDLYALKSSLKKEYDDFREAEHRYDEVSKLLDQIKLGFEKVRACEANPLKDLPFDPSWEVDLSTTTTPATKPIVRWGDMSSDEDDLLKIAIGSLSGPVADKKPSVTLPGDFGTLFPLLQKQIEKFCTFHKWEVNNDPATNLSSQGVISFTENNDGSITAASLTELQRLALVSLYTCVGSLFLKPQALVDESNTEVALTYVCSVIAREKLSGDDKDLLKIAIKSGDGGKTTLKGRLHSLCATGSSAVELIFNSLEKLVSKFARELKSDQLDSETIQLITEKSFTSIEGMMSNHYRHGFVKVTKNVEKTDRRGKKTTVKETVQRKKYSPPDLTTSNLPLKAGEITKLNELRLKFNNRKAEVETRIAKVGSPTLFDKPRVCKEVVDEAYAKLKSLKSILKSRNDQIREKAKSLNSGNKPGPGHWAEAKSEVLGKEKDIPDSVYAELRW